MNRFQRIALRYNAFFQPLIESPRWGRRLSGRFAVITYTGRRSGRTFSLPIAYSREGDRLTIGAAFPEKKNWWRNFTGDGGPITVRIGGVDRYGHATAVQEGANVSVSVVMLPVQHA